MTQSTVPHSHLFVMPHCGRSRWVTLIKLVAIGGAWLPLHWLEAPLFVDICFATAGAVCIALHVWFVILKAEERLLITDDRLLLRGWYGDASISFDQIYGLTVIQPKFGGGRMQVVFADADGRQLSVSLGFTRRDRDKILELIDSRLRHLGKSDRVSPQR